MKEYGSTSSSLAPGVGADADADAKVEENSGSSWCLNAAGYHALICSANAVRAFEAGVVSSMIDNIQEEMHFNYAFQGTIAASPDFGLIPGTLVAMFILSRFPAQRVMTLMLMCIAFPMLACAAFPCKVSLVIARACAGFCWGFSAVHFIPWINHYGPETRRTVWIGMYNASLLIGIFGGYVAGGSASISGVRWTTLYAIDAVVMLLCALGHGCFPEEKVQVIKELKPFWSSGPMQLPEEVNALLSSPVFRSLLMFSGIVAGQAAFLLYFVVSLVHKAGFSEEEGYACIIGVMVTASIPGTLLGAWTLTQFGGYQNLPSSFMMFQICSVVSLLGAICVQVALSLNSKPLLIGGFFVLILVGTMPASAINGVAVSAVPHAAHFASGLQFSIQNLGKLLIPQVGGFVVHFVGIESGFFRVLGFLGVVNVITSYLGYRVACDVWDGKEATDTGSTLEGGGKRLLDKAVAPSAPHFTGQP